MAASRRIAGRNSQAGIEFANASSGVRKWPALTGQEGQEAQLDRAYRRKALIACQGLARILHKAVDCYDGDLESFAIYLSVVCASLSAAHRDPDVLALPADAGPLPDSYHRPVSRRAIAASTGLPRETVRRKIAQLVAAGRLTEEPQGVRTQSGVLGLQRNAEFAVVLIREIERSALEFATLARRSAPGTPPEPS